MPLGQASLYIEIILPDLLNSPEATPGLWLKLPFVLRPAASEMEMRDCRAA